jgi:hypothetical protein
MAATSSPSSIPDFPAEMIASVATNASHDADCVGLFLKQLGLEASPEKPRTLPVGFLLQLAAALRLLVWESQGFFFHRQAGLPEARQAIRDAFQALAKPDADPTEFCEAVIRLSVQRFAWCGPYDLAANVGLDDLTDDAALDALAEYLWATRHIGQTAGRP